MKIIELVASKTKKKASSSKSSELQNYDVYVYDTTDGKNPHHYLVGTLSQNIELFTKALEDSRYVTYVNNHGRPTGPFATNTSSSPSSSKKEETKKTNNAKQPTKTAKSTKSKK
ncbi:MAG: hypothetical protein J6V44_16270 [Methanobrevibacter sp.]|nr:hypothetical protein [Methanobrevibacter sp.]MBO7692043.1 hypothetical protein [Methanobrevibacter sp.]